MMHDQVRWRTVLERLRPHCGPEQNDRPAASGDTDAADSPAADPAALRAAMEGEAPVDIALALEQLEPGQAAAVFDVPDLERATGVLACLGPARTAAIAARLRAAELRELVAGLDPADAAAVIADAPPATARALLDVQEDTVAVDARQRMAWREGQAGPVMTTSFLQVPAGITVARALSIIRASRDDPGMSTDIYVVRGADAGTRLIAGVVSIRDLVLAEADASVDSIMATDVIAIRAADDVDDAARLLAAHRFKALPVTDGEKGLVGVIPADTLLHAMVARLQQRYARAVGTDAEVMDRLTPVQAAKKRLPWLLGTMVIELGAGLIIAHCDHVLQRVIMLASFMPVISAISGNVGLQAAAITVRALDTGHLSVRQRGAAIAKEAATTVSMALVCGLVLGLIGVLWSGRLFFGVVIGVALAASMLTAGLMGTVIPMVSTRLGFDPATTAGPFETAFQDVIGFGVFLALASLLVEWL